MSIARLNLKFNYPSCNGRRVSRFPEHPSQIQTPKQFACDPSKAPNAKENPHERSVSHSRSSYSGTARKPFHAMVNVILPEIKNYECVVRCGSLVKGVSLPQTFANAAGRQ